MSDDRPSKRIKLDEKCCNINSPSQLCHSSSSLNQLSSLTNEDSPRLSSSMPSSSTPLPQTTVSNATTTSSASSNKTTSDHSSSLAEAACVSNQRDSENKIIFDEDDEKENNENILPRKSSGDPNSGCLLRNNTSLITGEEEDSNDEYDIVDGLLDSSNSNCNSSLSEMQIFIMGFRSCARETIDYLIEDEGLSADDPIVVNIRDHLKLKEKLYIMQWLAASVQGNQRSLASNNQLNCTFTSIDSGYASANDQTLLSITSSSTEPPATTTTEATISTTSSTTILTKPNESTSLSIDINDDYTDPQASSIQLSPCLSECSATKSS